MARKVETITIEKEGRDKGKRFLITEMPASKAEWWAYQAVTKLLANGVELPNTDDVEKDAGQGMASFAQHGIAALGKIPPQEAKPLLNEMMECVKICPNPSDPTDARRLYEDDIEEVSTLFQLRLATLKLHLDFFTPASA
ncbi:hypothetical protein LMG33818_000052 [Halomonadaceae bacterium LMG 33818]